jgi:hypothetical protein
MKKYFLHNGTESSGPFSFDELRIKKISKTTPVWFEGMEKWKYAKDIEELQSLIKTTPPPLQMREIPTRSIPSKVNEVNITIFGLSKNVFLALSVIVLLIIFTIVFDAFQDQRSEELETKNRITEKENQQYLLQQKEIEEQKLLLKQQEEAEAERSSNEKKLRLNTRLKAIENEKAIATENLALAEEKLIDANKFKLLRSQAEKTEEIKTIQKEIDSLKKVIEILNDESDVLLLELEKIK